MKKILAVIMVIAMLAIPVMAADESLGSVPSTPDTILVDGVKDAIYDQGLALPVGSSLAGATPAATPATAYFLRSADTLYICIEVTGESAYRIAADEADYESMCWGDEHIELIINRNGDDDQNNSENFSSGVNGYFYFNWIDQLYGAAADSYFETATVKADTAYTVEYAIPLNGQTDKLDLFMFLVNTDGTDFNEYSTLYEMDNVWNAANYNYIALDGAEVTANASTGSEDVDTGSEDVDTGADVTDDAPQTFDVAVISAIAAVITLAGAVISKKRK